MGYNGEEISDSEWFQAEVDSAERDACTEMFGEESEFCFDNDIGCK